MGIGIWLIVKVWLHGTTFGHSLKAQTARWLQSHVAALPSEKTLPVAIVNISRMFPQEYSVTVNGVADREAFTPRDQLQKLITQIAARRPFAIGLDIDMAIESELQPGTYLAAQTEALLRTALELSTRSDESRVAVFLGIRRNEARPPEEWLGSADYVRLAATLARPKGTVSEMPAKIVFPNNVTLKSLSQLLADEYRARVAEPQKKPAPWRELVTHPLSIEAPLEIAPEFQIHRFYVNYSAFDAMSSTNNLLNYAPDADLSAAFDLKDRLVLIGDAGQGADTAIVPGQRDPVPGVFVHGCAAYTLISARLRELTFGAGLIPVIGLQLLLVLVHWQCAKRHPAHEHEASEMRLTLGAVIVQAAVFAGLGLGLLAWQILWLDVFAACAVALFHGLIDVFFPRFHDQVAQAAANAIATAGALLNRAGRNLSNAAPVKPD